MYTFDEIQAVDSEIAEAIQLEKWPTRMVPYSFVE